MTDCIGLIQNYVSFQILVAIVNMIGTLLDKDL